ncbi:MFS transporter [Protaetiibacter intestinalis]|uniref:MFS transporter n=1 Tax=Protaetiibacter intestinalis TaxID=2419774 RepID=A0A387BL75_9MICO|nr:glycoside-pentoside-hexuronide (GPH):cation symporter [Protaetiibacter intestinalis]AYF99260.1 MFS transporter [Protaetiibacter intestinalis]
MTTKTSAPPLSGRVSMREKLSYAAGDIGSNLVFAPATSFVLFYFTDIAGIGAAIAGTAILLGQLLNGVVDLVVGVLIDKTKTRWGKTRPWILWSALPLMMCFVLMFSVPSGLDDTGKVVWAFVTYALVMAVFFTASNVAYSALLSVMTPDSTTRVTLTTFRFFAAIATTLAVSYATFPLVGALGGGQQGWTTTASIYAVLGLGALLTVFFGTRERLRPTDEFSSTRRPVKELLGFLFRNRYFWLAAALFVGFYLFNGMNQAAGVYFAADILGDPAAFGTLSLAALAPLLIGIVFMPALVGRFGKRRMFLAGIAIQIAGSIVVAIAPENLGVVLAGLLIRGVGGIPFSAALFAIVADVVDFGEWKFGVRIDGLTYSAVVFGQKIGAGLGAAGTGWILAFGAYDADLREQPASAISAIEFAYIYAPIALLALTAVAIWFLDVEKHGLAIRQFLQSRNAAAPSS